MKTDNYLTLCLEQAAKSPLHYRHGCIVVRGGKVIGQGYNDYRPGFDGGSLKHGRVAKGALDGPAMADLKEKLKKQKEKPKQKPQQQEPTKTFTPYEGTGGGPYSNVPLSMHSEMMAVHSALAASSTLSSTAFSCEKPSFKLPRSDKRKTRLRAEALKRYVNTVCDAASAGTATSGSGQLQVQECGFEARASQPSRPPPGPQQQEATQGGQGGQGGRGSGAQATGCSAARAQRMPSGLSCASEWRETSSPSEAEREGKESEEQWRGSVRVSVRPVWTTDTTAWSTTALCV